MKLDQSLIKACILQHSNGRLAYHCYNKTGEPQSPTKT
jgi:hypothetical protein